jgi:hypothetical protein
LPVTNTLAYFALSAVMKEKSFMTLTPVDRFFAPLLQVVIAPGEVVAVPEGDPGLAGVLPGLVVGVGGEQDEVLVAVNLKSNI